MTLVHTTPEFVDFSESEVFEALNDENPANPIAVEVARLVEGYTRNFAEHVENLGHIPPSILRSKGSCPIESVAMRLTSDAIREAMEGDK
mgnify:CR=1 FL=1|tara:strand:- start:106 stop:375 length:270 start_codon:yes stop_codon:yes gene_type:complete